MYLDWLLNNPDIVWAATLEHLRMSLLAVAIALPLALVLSIGSVVFAPLRQPVLWVVGTLYTIPSLAMLAFLIPSQGLGLRPTLILLVMYAQIFLVRNMVTGLSGVNTSTIEAAYGVGMTTWQCLVQVWIPIALPVMLAGVRIALTTVIGLAVLGGWAAAGGLGEILFMGISSNNPQRVMAGVVAIVALALAADGLMRALELLTPMARARRAGAQLGVGTTDEHQDDTRAGLRVHQRSPPDSAFGDGTSRRSAACCAGLDRDGWRSHCLEYRRYIGKRQEPAAHRLRGHFDGR